MVLQALYLPEKQLLVNFYQIEEVLFSADNEVKKLYKKSFINLIRKKFNIKNKSNIKSILKKEILNNKSNIKKLEKIIHPLVRKEMKNFIKKNKLKKSSF